MRSLLYGGLAFTIACSIVACASSTPAAPIAQPTSQPPTSTGSPPTEVPAAAPTNEAGWTTVKSFSGKDGTTTPAFHISGDKWRIIWMVDAPQPQYAVFNMFVYSQTGLDVLVDKVSYSQDVPAEPVTINEGGHDYYLKIISANLNKWTLDVEDYASQSSGQPVQITEIQYKGMDYIETAQTNHEIVEWNEYIEIKNFGDTPQNIAGWQLKNITKGVPIFTFPLYKPCSCEFLGSWSKCVEECYPPRPDTINPRMSIRVYTGEPQWGSGGYCFYYPPGDVWNNETPDTAVLYNAEGQEVSRRSYIIPTKDYAPK